MQAIKGLKMDEIILVIIFILILVFIVECVCFFIKKKRTAGSGLDKDTGVVEIMPSTKDTKVIQSSDKMMSLIEKIEIANDSGQILVLSNIDSSSTLGTRKFQEIAVRGSAIGMNLVQSAMPVLTQAQTLTQIAKTAPNGVFTATAPLADLMRYKDGTLGSIVMKDGKMAGHSGFQEVTLSVTNPAAVVGAGMQAMAMISGQYYMDKISKQLDGMEHGIEKLIDFHHDANIGKLRSIENQMKEIIRKKYVDETDIIALQMGIRDADSVLMEYSTRLERLSKEDTLIKVRIRELRSHLSVAKEMKKLRANTKEHELYYSFQICLFASRLMLESKKAEFATWMKNGETEKAIEVLEAFRSMRQQSFINNAYAFLDDLYKPISDKAESLVERQWFASKTAKGELESIEAERTELYGLIDLMASDSSEEEMIQSIIDDREILYLPSGDGAKQRIFISVRE